MSLRTSLRADVAALGWTLVAENEDVAGGGMDEAPSQFPGCAGTVTEEEKWMGNRSSLEPARIT